MQKLAIVICYFGSWPRWMHLFMESCRLNPTVDFVLVTDCGACDSSCDNVKRIEMTLASFQELAVERLGIELEIADPYKLSDYKPFYGVLFEEVLRGYDFWAYADLDVIYGDIRSFLTDDVLHRYDVISSRPEFTAGHFTLWRNTPELSRLFEQSKNWRRVLQLPNVCSFGECGKGLQGPLIYGHSWEKVAPMTEVDSIMHVLDRNPDIRVLKTMLCEEQIDLSRRYWDKLSWEMRWDKGKMVDVQTSREVMYFHLQFCKALPSFFVPPWDEVPETYRLTRNGAARVTPDLLVTRLQLLGQRSCFYAKTVFKMSRRFVGRLWERLPVGRSAPVRPAQA